VLCGTTACAMTLYHAEGGGVKDFAVDSRACCQVDRRSDAGPVSIFCESISVDVKVLFRCRCRALQKDWSSGVDAFISWQVRRTSLGEEGIGLMIGVLQIQSLHGWREVRRT
jgi:hypothetical protein